MLLFFSVGKRHEKEERERDGSVGWGRAVSEKFEPLWTLRQRVAHVLVGLGEELLLFVGAGQRVAAVVGAHVEGGVHRVGEVSGLRGKGRHFNQSFLSDQQN